VDRSVFAHPLGHRTAGSARLGDRARVCVTLFLCARITLSILGAVGAKTVEEGTVSVTSGIHNAFDGTYRWDAPRFTSLARNGYDDASSASLFPGYPLAIRAVSWLIGGNTVAAAILISNAAFFGSLVLLYSLTEDEYGRPLARRTVVLLTTFPTAFFLLAPYSESLYLLLTLLAFRAARRDRWFAGGVAGSYAAATRAVGIFLVPALTIEACGRWRSAGGSLWRRLVGVGLIVVGPAVYVAYWALRGAPSQVVAVQGLWQRQLRFPISTLGEAWVLGIQGLTSSSGIFWTIDALIASLVLVPLIVTWRSIRPSYLVYATGSLLLPLTYAPSERPLVCVPRYLVVVFPAFWSLALSLRSRWAFVAFASATALTGCALSVAFMNLQPIF
jgi:hypothetical protein